MYQKEKRTHGAPTAAYLVPARPGDHQLPGAGGQRHKEAESSPLLSLAPSVGCVILSLLVVISCHCM